MIRLEMDNYNTKLTEKLQIYQYYHVKKSEKMINMNILQVTKYCFLIKVEL